MIVYPALDLRDGRVVRLSQGDYDRATRYPDDPVETAAAYERGGARWLHLVDLDAARDGGFAHLDVLERIVRRTRLAVQAGGGVRSASHVRSLLDAGAARVVVGSLAVRAPDQVLGWLAAHGPERICIALDARAEKGAEHRLRISGWTEDAGATLAEVLDRYAAGGARHVLCTDIERDGMLTGPNLALYRRLARRCPSIALQASGGIRTAFDARAAAAAGVAGVVVGRALLERRVAIADLLAC